MRAAQSQLQFLFYLWHYESIDRHITWNDIDFVAKLFLSTQRGSKQTQPSLNDSSSRRGTESRLEIQPKVAIQRRSNGNVRTSSLGIATLSQNDKSTWNFRAIGLKKTGTLSAHVPRVTTENFTLLKQFKLKLHELNSRAGKQTQTWLIPTGFRRKLICRQFINVLE